ncbi:MAG TPA: alpha/beta hydrolase-fold protein [Actinophytocola sp.]|nr:alpha/beta hydrolase-fold protein [Actinophytocola sp.]
MIGRLSDMPLTAWWPVGTMLLVLGLLVALAAVRAVTRRLPRVLLGLLSVVAVLASAGVGVNAHYGYFRTLGEAVGAAPPGETTLDRVRAGARAGQGTVVSFTIPPTASGFAARQAQVYLPPAWSTPRQAPLPVVLLLHGTPGNPTDWVEGGQAQVTADAWASQHGGVAPVLVMPDINGSMTGDTECVDSPLGRVETYLTVDLPAAVRTDLATLPPGPGWAVAGLSEGGSCAVMLALRHPDMFGAFGDFGGLAGPRVGETNADTASTVAQLFGGSQQEFAAHEPADLLASARFPRTGGWFQVGALDAEPIAAARQLAPLAAAAGIATCLVVVPDAGHTFDVWAAAFQQSLPWLAQRLGLVPATPAAACPPPASST